MFAKKEVKVRKNKGYGVVQGMVEKKTKIKKKLQRIEKEVWLFTVNNHKGYSRTPENISCWALLFNTGLFPFLPHVLTSNMSFR